MKKQILIFLFILLSVGAWAQDNTLTFNHMALAVKDLNRSAEFYSRVLMLKEITNRTKSETIRWFSMGDGKELHLITNTTDKVVITKAVHLALTARNFDEFVKSLEKMNIPYSDWPGVANKINIRADGVKQIYIQDPDGYWIEVNTSY